MITKICKQCNTEFKVHLYRDKTAMFCSISCKAIKERTGSNLSKETKDKIRQKHLGMKPTPKTLKKLRDSHLGQIAWNKDLKGFMAGNKNGRWIEDRTKIKLFDKRNNSENKNWKKKIKERDEYSCRMANKCCCGQLEVHHILRWSDFPELRYELDNGITLCHFHHPKSRAEENKLSSYFKKLLESI